MVGLVEAGGAMQGAAIVPDDALAWAPPVRINAGRWRDHPIDLLDQRTAFVVIHAFNPLGMVAEEYRLSPSVRMCTHDRVCDRRHLGLLLCCERILAVAAGP